MRPRADDANIESPHGLRPSRPRNIAGCGQVTAATAAASWACRVWARGRQHGAACERSGLGILAASTCVPPCSPCSCLTIFQSRPPQKLANLHTQSTVFPSARLNRMRMVVIRLARRFWSPGIATRDRGVLVCMPVLLMSGKAFPAGRPSDSFLNGAKTVLLPRFSQFRPRPL